MDIPSCENGLWYNCVFSLALHVQDIILVSKTYELAGFPQGNCGCCIF